MIIMNKMKNAFVLINTTYYGQISHSWMQVY